MVVPAAVDAAMHDPVKGVLDATWDFPNSAFEARILRLLHWFGLLQRRQEEQRADRPGTGRIPEHQDLLRRFVRFNVGIEPKSGLRH